MGNAFTSVTSNAACQILTPSFTSYTAGQTHTIILSASPALGMLIYASAGLFTGSNSTTSTPVSGCLSAWGNVNRDSKVAFQWTAPSVIVPVTFQASCAGNRVAYVDGGVNMSA